jgi:hypothetical protein
MNILDLVRQPHPCKQRERQQWSWWPLLRFRIPSATWPANLIARLCSALMKYGI